MEVEVEGQQMPLVQELEEEEQEQEMQVELLQDVEAEECFGTEEVEEEVVCCTLHWTWNHLVSAAVAVPSQAGEQDGVGADQVVLQLLHDVCCVMEED